VQPGNLHRFVEVWRATRPLAVARPGLVNGHILAEHVLHENVRCVDDGAHDVIMKAVGNGEARGS